MRLAAEVSFIAGLDARRSQRQPSALSGSLREDGNTRIGVSVVNLSSHGCRLEFGGELPEGALISVKIPEHQPWQARIIWSKRGAAGCEFTHPLHPAVVQELSGLSARRP